MDGLVSISAIVGSYYDGVTSHDPSDNAGQELNVDTTNPLWHGDNSFFDANAVKMIVTNSVDTPISLSEGD